MIRRLFILIILYYASLKDIKSLEIPDFCFILIMLCSKRFSLPNIISFLCVAFVYIALLIASSAFKKEVPIGMGDAKLFAALAFSLGLYSMAKIFCFSSIASGLYALILIITKRSKEKYFPLAPFILIGYAVFLICI